MLQRIAMDTQNQTEAIHPLGEGEFAFPTPGGRVRLSVTNDSLTPFGGLVPWATVIGLGAGVVVFGALLLALRRPLGTGDGAAMGNPVVSALRRSAQRPLLPAVVVGVAVGLLAYA